MLIERIFFILNKFLNEMRRDLGAAALPPKPRMEQATSPPSPPTSAVYTDLS